MTTSKRTQRKVLGLQHSVENLIQLTKEHEREFRQIPIEMVDVNFQKPLLVEARSFKQISPIRLTQAKRLHAQYMLGPDPNHQRASSKPMNVATLYGKPIAKLYENSFKRFHQYTSRVQTQMLRGNSTSELKVLVAPQDEDNGPLQAKALTLMLRDSKRTQQSRNQHVSSKNVILRQEAKGVQTSEFNLKPNMNINGRAEATGSIKINKMIQLQKLICKPDLT